MKEYFSNKGGRYTYIDDMENLQDLALSITSVFEGCGDFIISGCDIVENELTGGYVYINGKIRYCDGKTILSQGGSIYIYEDNTSENVSYVDSGDRIGRILYGCVASETLKSVPDSITGELPKYIQIDRKHPENTPHIKDAFFGKYAVLLDSESGIQNIINSLKLKGFLEADRSVTSHESIGVERLSNLGTLTIDQQQNLVLQRTGQTGSKCRLCITQAGEFSFFNGNTELARLSDAGCVFKTFIRSNIIRTDVASFTGSHIYNHNNASDVGELNINVNGYGGRHDYFRVTNIGDGKGGVVMSVKGKGHTVRVSGMLDLRSETDTPIECYARHGSHDPALVNYISWKDNGNALIMKLGYTSSKDNSFYISNSIGSVTITSDCNINGTLKLNDRDVTEQFVDTTQYKNDMQKKANATDVYSKTDADNTFLKLSGEFTALVNHIGGDAKAAKAKLRGQIDAVYTGDMVKYPLHQHKLLDMVLDGLPSEPQENPEHESARQQQILRNRQEICSNIGAVLYTNPMATVGADTKIQLDGSAFDTSKSELYIRRCGRIILIQGTLVPVRGMNQFHAFTLPPEFPAPNHRITQRLYYREHRMSCSLGGQFGAHFTIDNDNQSTMYVSMMYIFS